MGKPSSMNGLTGFGLEVEGFEEYAAPAAQ